MKTAESTKASLCVALSAEVRTQLQHLKPFFYEFYFFDFSIVSHLKTQFTEMSVQIHTINNPFNVTQSESYSHVVH